MTKIYNQFMFSEVLWNQKLSQLNHRVKQGKKVDVLTDISRKEMFWMNLESDLSIYWSSSPCQNSGTSKQFLSTVVMKISTSRNSNKKTAESGGIQSWEYKRICITTRYMNLQYFQVRKCAKSSWDLTTNPTGPQWSIIWVSLRMTDIP